MSFKKIIIIAFLIFTTVPIYKIYAATPVVEKKTTTDALGTKTNLNLSETVTENSAIKKITAWVVAHTPNFIKTAVSQSVTMLEKFRTGSFNSGYIFYPVLFIFLYFLIRFVWDFFFY